MASAAAGLGAIRASASRTWRRSSLTSSCFCGSRVLSPSSAACATSRFCLRRAPRRRLSEACAAARWSHAGAYCAVAECSLWKSMKTSCATSSASCGSARTRFAIPTTRAYSAVKRASNASSSDFAVAIRRAPRFMPTVHQAPPDAGLWRRSRLVRAKSEGPSPDPDREEPGEDDHRVDALSALPVPVDVLHVEPQGKLIESEGGADAKGDRGQARDPGRSDADLEQPDVADNQQQEDSPHQVVDVQAAAGDVVKRPDAGADQMRDASHDRESDEKRHRRQEQALPALILKM